MRRRSFLFLAASPWAPAAAPFHEELWSAVAPVFAETMRHPFLLGLQNGSLPRRKFQFYLIQDALYLARFSEALNLLAAKAPRPAWAAAFRRDAVEAVQVERRMHTAILSSYGIPPSQIDAAVIAPTNRAYTNHLFHACRGLSFPEALAAMLPCYWIYWEAGKELKKRGSTDNTYQRWIDQYSTEEYAQTVRRVLSVIDEAAATATPAQRASAKRLFLQSTRFEYQFWDMAWREEH
ncbi:MAG: thiaminase II [Bryobacterales bacterium]|nr:thiaminase II [Bryobacterales bacterium]